MSAQTCFGAHIDALAREHGGWPEDAVVHGLEVIGRGDNPAVMFTGNIVVGTKPNGRPLFSKDEPLQAMCRMSEYRAAISRATPTAEGVA